MTARAAEQTQTDYMQLLASIFDFMRKSGIRDTEVRNVCTRALRASARDVHCSPRRSATLSVAALTLDAWHRNRRYLDRNAEPRAIPLLGHAPSVEALIRAEKAHADPRALARRFKSLGLVIRSGRNHYKPANRIALIKGLDPTLQQYVARSSATLLKTIRHNIKRERDSSRLIERFAEIPDLPQQRIAEFRNFARTQGWEFLRTLNDWLESRRARRLTKRTARTVRAGVHLYAYIEPSRK